MAGTGRLSHEKPVNNITKARQMASIRNGPMMAKSNLKFCSLVRNESEISAIVQKLAASRVEAARKNATKVDLTVRASIACSRVF